MNGEMSEGEYQYQMGLCDTAGLGDIERPPAPQLPEAPKGFWRVRGGALLEISRMTDEHLENAVAYFIDRGWPRRHKKLRELRVELRRRGRSP